MQGTLVPEGLRHQLGVVMVWVGVKLGDAEVDGASSLVGVPPPDDLFDVGNNLRHIFADACQAVRGQNLK